MHCTYPRVQDSKMVEGYSVVRINRTVFVIHAEWMDVGTPLPFPPQEVNQSATDNLLLLLASS